MVVCGLQGDYGVVPGGSYRWEVQKQTTKKSLLSPNEPIGLLGVKGSCHTQETPQNSRVHVFCEGTTLSNFVIFGVVEVGGRSLQ